MSFFYVCYNNNIEVVFMKKVFVSLFLSVLIVSFVYLLGISMYKTYNTKINDMYMEVTIMENGDVNVKKAISFNEKNNVLSVIDKNYTKTFESDNLDSYRDSKIYNYDNFKLNELSKIELFGNDVDDIRKSKLEYKEEKNNFSINGKLVYMEYTLTNHAISHNDLGELLFSVTENSKIDNMEVVISIPNNKNILEFYLHGNAKANIESINSSVVRISAKNIGNKDNLDVRILFDKDVIKNSYKKTNVNALSSILEVEGEISDEYIKEQKVYSYKSIIGIILDVIKTIWLALTIFMLMITYLKHDKEYKRRFKKNTLKEIPSEIEPYELEFLSRCNVTQNSITGALLKMIKDGKLTIKKHEDSYLIKRSKKKLTDEEDYLVNLLFKSGVIDIKDLVIKEKETYSEYTYDKLINIYLIDGISKNYYEDETDLKKKLVLYSFIGILLNVISYLVIYNEMIMVIIYLVALTTMIYFLAFRKKTKKGNEEYAKWEAYNRYITNNELNEDNYMDALIYGSIIGNTNKILSNLKVDNDIIKVSKILLNTNLLRK